MSLCHVKCHISRTGAAGLHAGVTQVGCCVTCHLQVLQAAAAELWNILNNGIEVIMNGTKDMTLSKDTILESLSGWRRSTPKFVCIIIDIMT